MKTKAELEKDIINITMEIRQEFPELSKYISEMPENFSGKAYNPTGIEHFKEHYNSLEEVLVEYAKTHVAKKIQRSKIFQK